MGYIVKPNKFSFKERKNSTCRQGTQLNKRNTINKHIYVYISIDL